MYTRAAASDYDDWETKHQNPGWGSAKLIPLLKKVSYPPFLQIGFLQSKTIPFRQKHTRPQEIQGSTGHLDPLKFHIQVINTM